jgi:hypothetical protein
MIIREYFFIKLEKPFFALQTSQNIKNCSQVHATSLLCHKITAESTGKLILGNVLKIWGSKVL